MQLLAYAVLGRPDNSLLLHAQEDVLRECLNRFYSRAEGDEEGVTIYSRSKEQTQMLLLYLLMTALIAEDYQLGPRQFEALRSELKLAPQELVTCYRWVRPQSSMVQSIHMISSGIDWPSQAPWMHCEHC